MSFEKELEIGKRVREVAIVNRVIPFGGTGNTIETFWLLKKLEKENI